MSWSAKGTVAASSEVFDIGPSDSDRKKAGVDVQVDAAQRAAVELHRGLGSGKASVEISGDAKSITVKVSAK